MHAHWLWCTWSSTLSWSFWSHLQCSLWPHQLIWSSSWLVIRCLKLTILDQKRLLPLWEFVVSCPSITCYSITCWSTLDSASKWRAARSESAALMRSISFSAIWFWTNRAEIDAVLLGHLENGSSSPSSSYSPFSKSKAWKTHMIHNSTLAQSTSQSPFWILCLSYMHYNTPYSLSPESPSSSFTPSSLAVLTKELRFKATMNFQSTSSASIIFPMNVVSLTTSTTSVQVWLN